MSPLLRRTAALLAQLTGKAGRFSRRSLARLARLPAAMLDLGWVIFVRPWKAKLPPPKIIGFAQLRNEFHRGNLENFIRSMNAICDVIYIYDQNSDDGSKDFYKQCDNVRVIYSDKNDFERERMCKQVLLQKIQQENSEDDWIFTMDGDAILDGRLDAATMRAIIQKDNGRYDAYVLGHFNLWRSDLYYRTDNRFDYMDYRGVTCFWRNKRTFAFESTPGLHGAGWPSNLKWIKRLGYYLIHRGFATDQQIMERLLLYTGGDYSAWPRGRPAVQEMVDRFFDEENLKIARLDDAVLPKWFVVRDPQSPLHKPKLKELYPKPPVR